MPAARLPEKGAQLTEARKSNKNLKYSELRDREYLLESEVKAMMSAAKSTGRSGHRDSTLILVAFRTTADIRAGRAALAASGF